MHTTNYTNTLITVSPDTKRVAAVPPPVGRASITEMQFAMLHGHDYELTSDDVVFAVFADRKGVAADDRAAARDRFFSRGQPCMRTSPLAKNYGWGVHADETGRVALVAMETSTYHAMVNDDAIIKRPARRHRARARLDNWRDWTGRPSDDVEPRPTSAIHALQTCRKPDRGLGRCSRPRKRRVTLGVV